MMAWLHQATASEKEHIQTLLKNCKLQCKLMCDAHLFHLMLEIYVKISTIKSVKYTCMLASIHLLMFMEIYFNVSKYSSIDVV